MMNRYYIVLFALSIVLVNPFGSDRGEIWTQPKVAVLFVIVVSNIAILAWEEHFPVSRRWWVCLGLWLLFLAIGLVSTLNSPFPLHSFLGQAEMGDGWLYWCLVAAFTLSNSLLLKVYPQVGRSQLFGLLFGGLLLAVASVPQLINWQIDYTITSGQVLEGDILVSTVFKNHQPIGFYSHRGHAAIVLAMTAMLASIAWQKKWLSRQQFLVTFVPIVVVLLLNGTRMAVVALAIALAFQLGRKYYKQLAIAISIGLVVVGIATTQKQLPGLSIAQQLTSDRVYLWQMAGWGIQRRPLFGWGFDGFGIAYPYVKHTPGLETILRIDDFTFDYRHEDGSFHQEIISSNKAHNLILDTTISVGILGTIAYFWLWLVYWRSLAKTSDRESIAIAILYLVFTFAWFECAQYAHLVWWVLSCANAGDRGVWLGETNAIAIEFGLK